MAQTLEHNKEVTTVVPVTIPAFDDDLNIIQKLDDEPNDVGGLTAAELKAKFDEGNLSAQQYINNVLIPTVIADDLSEQARQAAEAERVANEIDRVTNEQAREKAEKERVNETSGVVALATAQAEAAAESARKATQAALGQIVDGSLEPAKFSGESRSMMVRENLLDNAYFGNPVNQRGQTEYSGAAQYTIDRWKSTDVNLSLTVADGYITLDASAGSSYFRQLFENALSNLTVTISAVARGTGTLSHYLTNTSGTSGVETIQRSTVETDEWALFSATYTADDLTNAIGGATFAVSAGGRIDLLAGKLELGSEQTLAHQDEDGNWVLNEIPNYAEERAKCQTCLIPWGGSNRVPSTLVTANIIDFIVPVPVTMRATPAIDTSLLAVCSLDGTAQSGFTFSNVTVETGFIRIRATKKSHGLSAACLYPTTKVFFDAGL